MSFWRMLLPLMLVASCTTSVPGSAARSADIDAANRGLAYAQVACATCHAVTATDPHSPNPEAPPFVVIANLPGMTPTALNAWLHSSHPSMPNLIVAPSDRSDLAAYLQSLRQGRSTG